MRALIEFLIILFREWIIYNSVKHEYWTYKIAMYIPLPRHYSRLFIIFITFSFPLLINTHTHTHTFKYIVRFQNS